MVYTLRIFLMAQFLHNFRMWEDRCGRKTRLTCYTSLQTFVALGEWVISTIPIYKKKSLSRDAMKN